MKRFIIPIFISNQGCKYKCIFCNQSNISSESVKLDEIDKIIEKYIETQINKYGGIHKKYKKKQISFYGGSFTCLGEKRMRSYLNKVEKYIKSGILDSVRLSTRPDCIDENILEILKNYYVETIEIGAQTFNNRLLKNLNRGHTVEDIIKSASLIKKKSFELGIQVMVGVPGEEEKDITNMVDILINIVKPDFIRIYPLLVIKGTVLEQMYKNKKFFPLSNEETLKRCKKIFKNCLINGIEVIRIGLQDSELLKSNIIAGPFIPNIGEIVRNNYNLEVI